MFVSTNIYWFLNDLNKTVIYHYTTKVDFQASFVLNRTLLDIQETDSFYWQILTVIRAWIINHNTHPYHNFNGGFAKPPLKLGYGWMITFHCSMWTQLPLSVRKAPGAPFTNMALIARFVGSTWGPPGDDRTQMGPMLAPWILLSWRLTSIPVEISNYTQYEVRDPFLNSSSKH